MLIEPHWTLVLDLIRAVHNDNPNLGMVIEKLILEALRKDRMREPETVETEKA